MTGVNSSTFSIGALVSSSGGGLNIVAVAIFTDGQMVEMDFYRSVVEKSRRYMYKVNKYEFLADGLIYLV